MTTPQAPSKTPRLAFFGSGALAESLAKAASTAGIAAYQGTDPAIASTAASIWLLPDPDASALAAPSTPQVLVVTGYQPAGPAAARLPVLRLTHPQVAGSLAELTPPLQASDALSDALLQDAQALGYTTVALAGTREGFAQRVSYALMIEAMALLGEGVAPAQIESAASTFGFAMPPLLMIDHLSLHVLDELLHDELHQLAHDHQDEPKHDHGHDHKHGHDHGHDHEHDHGHGHDHDHGHEHKHDHGHGHSHGGVSKRMPESAVYVLEKMAHGFDRQGVDSGYGLYEHEEDGSAELWDGLSVFARGARAVPPADVQDRLVCRLPFPGSQRRRHAMAGQTARG